MLQSLNPISLSIPRVRWQQKRCEKQSDEELLVEARRLGYEFRRKESSKNLYEIFGLVCEIATRGLEINFYDVQILAGYHLAKCRIAEMMTGEGKTFTGLFPIAYHGLGKKGVHVATVNDYLAKRDSELLAPVLERLGVTVGLIQTDMPPQERAAAYKCNVTFGTAKEFGFDFLRDRLGNMNGQPPTMRELNYILVDEADSILIDEARTPLIIGLQDNVNQQKESRCYRWAQSHVEEFEEDKHFEYEHDKRKVKLTTRGLHIMRGLPNHSVRGEPARRLQRLMETAIKVKRDFLLDKHYAIREGEIVIIDENTGRPAEGRQWQNGIHQAIQAKEDVEITIPNKTAASVTMQSFFKRYKQVSGMTGTAWTSRRELKKAYKKRVVRIPTNKPSQRKELKHQFVVNWQQKCDAIVADVKLMIEKGRSVLIGTRSVGRSELVGKYLDAAGIEHSVLNARNLEREAELVEQAGQPGRVTVSTNMAGRGTDIKLHPDVKKAGGLHVILTEIHESQRIDRQLIGRSGRQGDPGSYRLILSMQDEILLLGLGPKRFEAIQRQYEGKLKVSGDQMKVFKTAQTKLERKFLTDRMILLRQTTDREKLHLEMGRDPYLEYEES